jgi:hypothetical protein
MEVPTCCRRCLVQYIAYRIKFLVCAATTEKNDCIIVTNWVHQNSQKQVIMCINHRCMKKVS